MRPNHWLKNLFVFLPVFFSGKILLSDKLVPSLYAFIVFSLTASATYIINDIFDQKQDVLHPSKKSRPLAAGQVSMAGALALTVLLLAVAGLLIYFIIPSIAPVIFSYLLLNFFYSVFLKKIPLMDILVVAGFYLMRITTGGLASDILLSRWLIICTIFITLFLVIAKRKAEFNHHYRRSVLDFYQPQFLDWLLIISAALTLVSYSIYTVLGATSQMAVYSVFFVIFGLFRYLQLAYQSAPTEEVDKVILSDRIILFSLIAWLIFMYFVVYAPLF